MKKVLIVIGHTSGKDKGAFSDFLKLSEFDYNYKVYDDLKSLSNNNIQYNVYTHTEQSYYNRQLKMSDYVNSLDFDLVIELHFNSSDSSLANGTECLYYSEKGQNICKEISEKISSIYKTKLRGNKGSIKLSNKNDRGYWFVFLPKTTAIILEPFFGSNEESLKFKDTKQYASNLHKIISNLKLS